MPLYQFIAAPNPPPGQPGPQQSLKSALQDTAEVFAWPMPAFKVGAITTIYYTEKYRWL